MVQFLTPFQRVTFPAVYSITQYTIELLFFYYQLYQLGTGGRSQKDLACTRCLPKAITIIMLATELSTTA